jgi:hypothetical protein
LSLWYHLFILNMKRTGYFFAVLLLIIGLLLLASTLLPYPTLAALLNRLAADGTIESFTPTLHQALIPLFLLFGGFFTFLGISPIIFPRRSRHILALLGTEWRAFRSDSVAFYQTLRHALPTGWQAFFLGLIILVGIFARIVFVWRPMQHDEAYTVMAFANTPLFNLLSDYHLPNNHIFHTLMVHLSIQIFGLAPWAVRLPALLAGVMAIPAGYMFTRKVYGTSAALPVAAALALFPALLEYATNARGYTLIALFSLLGLTLALYLKDHFNRLGWMLLVLCMALGFWTIPIMLYPAGLIWLWLLGSTLLGNSPILPTRMLRHLIFSGLALVILTGLLYLPIFLRSGTGYVFNNPFIAPLTRVEFHDTFPVRMAETWVSWTTSLPSWLIILIVIGISLSILLHWKIANHRLPIQLTAAAWLAAEMLIALPNPYTRYFIFLLPLFLIWAVVGLIIPLELLRLPHWLHLRIPPSRLLSTVLTLFLLVGGLVRLVPHLSNLRNDPGEIEQIAIYLVENTQPGDVIISAAPMDTPLWYYLTLHHLPKDAYFHPDESASFLRAFVMVTLSDGQTLEKVLSYAQAPASLDPASAEWLPFTGDNRLALVRIQILTP